MPCPPRRLPGRRHGLPALELREALSNLREVLERWCALDRVALEPGQHGAFELRRTALCVEVDELQRALERQVRKLASGILSHPQSSALGRSAQADARGYVPHQSIMESLYLRATQDRRAQSFRM
jgi:hypothetical protein